MLSQLQDVAPHSLIQQDFKFLDARETLRTTWQNEQILIAQSVQGRAHEGHGAFRGHKYPNTTMDDIVRALRLDPKVIVAERQAMIDGVRWYVDRVIEGCQPAALLDQHGAPLFGVSTLRFMRVDPADVLRGLYTGGLRDESETRYEVEQQRGIKVGGGKCYFVDRAKMQQMGYDADMLAHGEWANDLERFHNEGLIVDKTRAHDDGVVYQYIRHRRGPGASDDAAIVAAGMMWNLGVSVGVFLADAIDTIEKYVPEYSDQDAEIARHIEANYRDLRFTRDDVRTLTYLAAPPVHGDVDVPDSSLRHLLAIDRDTDLCAIEAHFLAVEGVQAPNIGLSHERASSTAFHAYVRRRVDELS